MNNDYYKEMFKDLGLYERSKNILVVGIKDASLIIELSLMGNVVYAIDENAHNVYNAQITFDNSGIKFEEDKIFYCDYSKINKKLPNLKFDAIICMHEFSSHMNNIINEYVGSSGYTYNEAENIGLLGLKMLTYKLYHSLSTIGTIYFIDNYSPNLKLVTLDNDDLKIDNAFKLKMNGHRFLSLMEYVDSSFSKDFSEDDFSYNLLNDSDDLNERYYEVFFSNTDLALRIISNNYDYHFSYDDLHFIFGDFKNFRKINKLTLDEKHLKEFFLGKDKTQLDLLSNETKIFVSKFEKENEK